MSEHTILIVDDEPYILNAMQRVLDDTGYRILVSTSAAEGLAQIAREEIAIVISDNLMPGMSGIDFLSRVKQVSPTTERVLMTAHADLGTAVDAINRGGIFRFIVKPWNNEALLSAIDDSMMHHKLVNTLKIGEESIFLSMARMIELKDRYTRGHCKRVAEYAFMIADAMRLDPVMRKAIKWGSWLHDCGKVGIPEHILNSTGQLSEEDFQVIRKHPEWGASVVADAGLSQQVINVVLHHHEYFSGGGYPHGLQGERIPLEARIVAVADVYDALSTDRPYRKAYSIQKTTAIMVEMKQRVLDPALVDLFFGQLPHLTEDGLEPAERYEWMPRACSVFSQA